MNSQYPGVSIFQIAKPIYAETDIKPLIEANWGDYIQVTVHNKITGPEEGTTLHWLVLRACSMTSSDNG